VSFLNGGLISLFQVLRGKWIIFVKSLTNRLDIWPAFLTKWLFRWSFPSYSGARFSPHSGRRFI